MRNHATVVQYLIKFNDMINLKIRTNKSGASGLYQAVGQDMLPQGSQAVFIQSPYTVMLQIEWKVAMMVVQQCRA